MCYSFCNLHSLVYLSIISICVGFRYIPVNTSFDFVSFITMNLFAIKPNVSCSDYNIFMFSAASQCFKALLNIQANSKCEELNCILFYFRQIMSRRNLSW